MFINSPTQKKIFQNQTIYIKRDDLLSKEFSGNKARKFAYFLEHDFPNVKKVVSYGSAQSNAMYSLSVLAKIKGWKFEYYIDHLASYLEENPHGNFKYALENGMKLHVGRGVP
ncbi:MAG TPA: 1-aminocyclopropane-1-carboxylate deaminase/D-cysteine desulfhydrase, partial [Campylobacterales bacterium]|nr:1-aminocyclopropane-1-carboxylate deaminase/D-cysteine desulfhydrase [Campylobacterales bacterium]